MSTETWQKEFCPTDGSRITTVLGALRHAKRKWHGCEKENLDKHGCKAIRTSSVIVDACMRRFRMDSKTCVLCRMFLPDDSVLVNSQCLCPLNGSCVWEEGTPWAIWRTKQDPKPMIEAIDNAIKEYENEEKQP